MAEPGSRIDPYRNFRFTIESDGITRAGFSEVTGFDISLDVIEYREGNEVTTPRKLPGLTKYSNITLKAGTIDAMDMYEWIAECVNGNIERQTLTLNLHGEESPDEVVASWTIYECWPMKYTAPDVNALGSEVAVETLELAHEGLKRTK